MIDDKLKWPDPPADAGQLGVDYATADSLDLLRARCHARLAGRFDVGDVVGTGATAVVFRAREKETGRTVALKVVRADRIRDHETGMRLKREAALLAGIVHPNIVATYGVFDLDPGVAIALEYMQGGSVRDRLRRREQFSVEEVRQRLREVASALVTVHAAGVIHRDLKPENVFLEAGSGRAKLGDFGIAKAVGQDSLTMTGSVIGTPAYMSPEQIDGGTLDARSDLYSLGVVGWEMLTGRIPWEGQTLFGMIHQQKTASLPSIQSLRPSAPADLVQLLELCMEKVPQYRPGSAAEVLGYLDGSRSIPAANTATIRFTASRQSPRKPRSNLIALGAIGVAIPLIVGALVSRSSSSTSAPAAAANPAMAADARSEVSAVASTTSAATSGATTEAGPPPTPISDREAAAAPAVRGGAARDAHTTAPSPVAPSPDASAPMPLAAAAPMVEPTVATPAQPARYVPTAAEVESAGRDALSRLLDAFASRNPDRWRSLVAQTGSLADLERVLQKKGLQMRITSAESTLDGSSMLFGIAVVNDMRFSREVWDVQGSVAIRDGGGRAEAGAVSIRSLRKIE